MKCVYCGGKTRLGIHDLCWIDLKRYVLSDKFNTVAPMEESQTNDNATYIDAAGRHIVQGRVVVPINIEELE